jgi:hypothetical protein
MKRARRSRVGTIVAVAMLAVPGTTPAFATDGGEPSVSSTVSKEPLAPGELAMVSLTDDGAPVRHSGSPAISGSGRYVAFISNGNGDGPIVLRHNTLHCDVEVNPVDGGCSTELSLFPDFAPIKNVTVDNNLLPASPSAGYCASFGWNPGKTHNDDPTNATGIKVTGNVFGRGANGKCGLFGPVTSFMENRPGNVWENNTWDNGGIVPPG